MRIKDKSLPLLLKRISEKYSNIPIQMYKGDDGEFRTISYQLFYQNVLDFSAGLISIGAKQKEHIGLISDNRQEWLCANFAILGIGAADVPRGCDATEQDIIHIFSVAECHYAILENDAQVIKILKNIENIPQLKYIITIDKVDVNKLEEEFSVNNKIKFISYTQLMEDGKKARADGTIKTEEYAEKVELDDLASIIFTSGTTGNPKGVTMTHRNFMAQMEELSNILEIKPGEKAISVLPVWHSFERACEYIVVFSAATVAYSKPIGSVLLADMLKINPDIFPSVPRIWEAVYDGIFKVMKKRGKFAFGLFNFFISVGVKTMRQKRRVFGLCPHFSKSTKILYPLASIIPYLLLLPLYQIGNLLIYGKIRQKLGTNFRVGVSGGGSLPPNIDEFFWAVGVNVVEGYGITETAPVVCVRTPAHPVFGTLGKPLECFEYKILDKNGNKLGVGQKGLLYLKGTPVTKGYYNDPQRTAEVIDSDGWFDTGDLAMVTIDGNLILRGRKKNTIVLRGGENIEPVPIEFKLQESPLISTAVVLGQDQRALGALIVVKQENLIAWANNNGFKNIAVEELVNEVAVQKLYETEVAELVNAKTGFKLFERINKIAILPNEFETGKELSAKGEMMRHKINKIYSKEIAELFT